MFVHRAQISPGACLPPRPKRPVPAASHENGSDGGNGPPHLQAGIQCLDQSHVDDIENGGTIEHGNGNRPGDLVQQRVETGVYVHVCLRISAMTVRRSILPVAPIGHCSKIRSSFGQNLRVILSRSSRRLISARVSFPSGLSWTQATGISPRRSSGTPTTMACTTSGWEATTSSKRAAGIVSAPRRITL